MNKDDLLKKTQDTAQGFLEKGKDIISNVIDKAKEAGDNLNSKVEPKVEEVKENTKEGFHGVMEKINDGLKNISKDAREKTEDIKKSSEETFKNVKEKITGEEIKPANGIGKAVAGMALATAAVAGAYTVYKKRKDREDTIKADFSEKLKKWNELSSEEIEKEKENKFSIHIKPTSMYKMGENALLGEDIIVNITPAGEEVTFNPENLGEPINVMGDIMGKASEVTKMVQEKLKEISKNVGEKATEYKEKAKTEADRLMEDFNEKKENLTEDVDSIKENVTEKAKDIKDELQYKVENIRSDIKDDLEKAKEDLNEEIENKMESDNESFEDKIVKDEKSEDVQIKSVYNPAGRNEKLEEFYHTESRNDEDGIKWEDNKGMLDEVKNIALTGFESFKKILGNVKEQISQNVGTFKIEVEKNVPEVEKNMEEEYMNKEKDLIDDETMIEEYNVVIHNRGNKDYFFSPLLIQRYNSKTRMSIPTPIHEEGTTLESGIIKPGETYEGKLAIRRSQQDDSLIVLEDMLMNNSTAILEKEVSSEVYDNEKSDIVDEILFEDKVEKEYGLDAENISDKQ